MPGICRACAPFTACNSRVRGRTQCCLMPRAAHSAPGVLTRLARRRASRRSSSAQPTLRQGTPRGSATTTGTAATRSPSPPAGGRESGAPCTLETPPALTAATIRPRTDASPPCAECGLTLPEPLPISERPASPHALDTADRVLPHILAMRGVQNKHTGRIMHRADTNRRQAARRYRTPPPPARRLPYLVFFVLLMPLIALVLKI